jgi:tetratricopeptide (TPR) repeat protein
LEIRVRLIQEPSIWVTGHRHPISPWGLGRVILFLVFLQGASSGRLRMAQVIWPGEPESVSSNRLRVSFTRLKALFGDALETDRTSVRLVGITVHLDLNEGLLRLQDALDEVDPAAQFDQLKSQADALRGVAWRQFEDLDASGLIPSWKKLSRLAVRQLMERAVQIRDWEAVDFAWELMSDRGELDLPTCERFLEASLARGDLDEGLRNVKRIAYSSGQDESGTLVKTLTKHAQGLREAQQTQPRFHASHYQLLGGALLDHVAGHAELLANLLVIPPVQFQLQAQPHDQLQILEAVQEHLVLHSPAWVEIQAARLSAYASLYNTDKVLEISKSLFPCEMSSKRAATTWMHYSFCMFQIREWDEAMSAIRKAQAFAIEGNELGRHEICRITEAAYLWHLGRVEEALQLYDAYFDQYRDSENFLVGINGVIAHGNCAIVELVFGDLAKAREHVDIAYDARSEYDLRSIMPNLLSTMSVIYARGGEVRKGAGFAIEALKLTYVRGSSREGQLNMESACGVLVVGGLSMEAYQILAWVNSWRTRTRHARSVSECRYYESLGLGQFEGSARAFEDSADYRDVMRFLVKCLRGLWSSLPATSE